MSSDSANASPFFPARLVFSIGGFQGPNTRIDLDGDALRVRYGRGRPIPRAGGRSDWLDVDAHVHPTPDAWQTFWSDAESAGVWTWHDYYDDPGIEDGIQWTLELEYDGRSVDTGGSNAYPDATGSVVREGRTDAFISFLDALADLGAPATDNIRL